MQPQRETQTDSLADIMQILHLGYRSGTLTVERGEGQIMEEGYLVFVNGRVVDARAGQYTGWAAFNYLKTWGTCRFSLSESVTEPITPTQFSQAMQEHPNAQNNGRKGPPTGSVLREYTTAPLSPRNSGPLTRIPVRLQLGDAALQHPDQSRVQRTHRRLLLLINGQRGQDELARLISRDLADVRVLLDELERAGFIRQ